MKLDMDTSIFLARLIGPALALVGLIIVLNPSRVRAMGREIIQGEAMIFLAGLITLVTGLALVNTHNIWVADWRVIITLLGWISIAGGVMRMAFPALVKEIGGRMMDHAGLIAVPGVIGLLLGGYICIQGYL